MASRKFLPSLASERVNPLATTTTARLRPIPSSTTGFKGRWARLLAPSYTDLFLVALVIWLFGVGEGWKGLALDGDTGWHIRTGEHILRHGSVPYTDLYSYSKAGAPWFAWEWLTDVFYALVHAKFGLAGIVAVSGVTICLTATVLLRQMLWSGANAMTALLLTLLFVGAGSMHYHARPHVFTLLFLTLFEWTIAKDRTSPTRWLWALVPMVALWTNMHGGFLAAVAYAGLISAGAIVQCLLARSRDWRVPARYVLLTASCLAASVINPYGIRLHQHVAEYLQSDFIRNVVQEFQSPVFRSENSLQYEAVLVSGLLISGLLLSRRQFPEAFTIIYFGHMSLMSARHVPLYVIVAAPVVAMELTRLWCEWIAPKSRRSLAGILDQVSIDFGAGFRRTTIWCPLGLIALLVLTPAEKWPADFVHNFPTKMVAKHGDLIAGSRVFSTDQWGDYLIYHLYPRQRVFIDGRSDFYGETLGKDYIALMNPDHRWASILERYGFNLILIPVKWPLGAVLKLSSNWRVIADDGTAILFAPVAAAADNQKSRTEGLMKRIAMDEGTRRDPAR
jgi:hypothetical protein